MSTQKETKEYLEEGYKDLCKVAFKEYYSQWARADTPEEREAANTVLESTLARLKEALKEAKKRV